MKGLIQLILIQGDSAYVFSNACFFNIDSTESETLLPYEVTGALRWCRTGLVKNSYGTRPPAGRVQLLPASW
jgi:hypothetical protein